MQVFVQGDYLMEHRHHGYFDSLTRRRALLHYLSFIGPLEAN